MRNIPKPLNDVERFVQTAALDALKPLHETGKVVEVNYRKRDASAGTSTGTVKFFNGEPGMDTGSVTIDTADKGPRTINLHRITSYRVIR